MTSTTPSSKVTGAALFTMGSQLRRGTASKGTRQFFLEGGREVDESYRQHHRCDRVVRFTHGVNRTDSCSWKVYVKNGVTTWESQATDYPSTGPNIPDYEPHGCPRGVTFS